MSNKSFLTPKYEVQEVAGRKVNFYAVSMRSAFKLRCIANPLARALTTLFQSPKRDAKTTLRNFGGATLGSETEMEPTSASIIELRSKQRLAAIEELIGALTSDENALILGELLMDSMREDFDRTAPFTPERVQTFLDDLDVVSFKDCLLGVAAANKKVFGPLGKQMATAMAGALDLEGLVAADDTAEPQSQPSEVQAAGNS
jgi:hypothetical protein